MSRKKEQAELLFKLGASLGPLLKMAESPDAYDSQERTRILARFFAEEPELVRAIREFAAGEPGHNYAVQSSRAENLIYSIRNFPLNYPKKETEIFDKIKTVSRRVVEVVQSIPVPVEASMRDASTPFSTYCFVKDLCNTAKDQIVWTDRYMDAGIFHQFLRDVRIDVLVTLMTWPDTKQVSAADKARFSAFMDVSRLFAVERAQHGYRLIWNDSFHDRWLRCDDTLLALGGSIKDLGKEVTFTISRLDPTQDNFDKLDELIGDGTQVFGPSQPSHP